LQQRRRSNSGLERSFERRFKGPMKNWRKWAQLFLALTVDSDPDALPFSMSI
jgi:hypothetical protein